MARILFVCSENRLRSPTAEAIFSRYKGVEAIGAGTNPNAATPVTEDLIEWADVILVMEKSHQNKISKKFREHLKNKKVGVLDIPDIYDYMEPVLVQLLENKVPRYVRI
jgi:predicted protein tyrosine phosphatase